MPLVHPSAGVNYHGSMKLSRFTSSEDAVLGMLEQPEPAVSAWAWQVVPCVAFPAHLALHVQTRNWTVLITSWFLVKKDEHLCFLWWFPSCFVCCFAQLMWNRARVNSGEPACPTAFVPPVTACLCCPCACCFSPVSQDPFPKLLTVQVLSLL